MITITWVHCQPSKPVTVPADPAQSHLKEKMEFISVALPDLNDDSQVGLQLEMTEWMPPCGSLGEFYYVGRYLQGKVRLELGRPIPIRTYVC